MAELGEGNSGCAARVRWYVNVFEDKAGWVTEISSKDICVTNNSVKAIYLPIGILDNLTAMAGVASHEKALLESEEKEWKSRHS